MLYVLTEEEHAKLISRPTLDEVQASEKEYQKLVDAYLRAKEFTCIHEAAKKNPDAELSYDLGFIAFDSLGLFCDECSIYKTGVVDCKRRRSIR